MKKSELIKQLQNIEGDPDILFSVNNDLFDDESYFTLLDNIIDIEYKKLAILNENIYEESDKQDLFYDLRNDSDLTDEQVMNKIQEFYQDRAIINLNCVWRNV